MSEAKLGHGVPPMVSVLMPTYNHGVLLERAIASVVAQTRADWEIIVIDDGSTDDPGPTIGGFRDGRIKLIRRPHGGIESLGDTYALGLESAEAPLVAILEGDDEWPVNKLEVQVPHFSDATVVLSYGAAELIDDRGRAFARYSRRPRGQAALNSPVGSIYRHLAVGNFIVAPTVIARRSALETIGGFFHRQGLPFVDHPTWLALALVGRFAYAEAILGRWRRHARQYTSAAGLARLPSSGYIVEIVAAARSEGRSSGGLQLADAERLRHAVDERRRKQQKVSQFRQTLLVGRAPAVAKGAADLLGVGRPRELALAMLGVACWLTGGDLEWLFAWRGRLSWPSRWHRRRGRLLRSVSRRDS